MVSKSKKIRVKKSNRFKRGTPGKWNLMSQNKEIIKNLWAFFLIYIYMNIDIKVFLKVDIEFIFLLLLLKPDHVIR